MAETGFDIMNEQKVKHSKSISIILNFMLSLSYQNIKFYFSTHFP